MKKKHTAFCEHYLQSLNHCESSERAGFKRSYGATLLRNKKIRQRIKERMMERSQDVKIDSAWVLKRLALVADFNICNFLVIDEDGIAYYDFSNATIDDWYCISEYTINVSRAKDKISAANIRLRHVDKLQALTLIMKHVDVTKFTNKVELSVDESIVDRITSARKRTR